MTKAFIKSFVALALLMGLIIVALPTLASDPHNQLRARGWTQLFPAVSPPPRSDTALAYDTARSRAILYGGYDGQEFDDTWEWDSASLTWVERLPATKPSARFGHAMVYDPARGLTWLFGGVIGSVEQGDTWAWDGQDWVQHFPEDAPSPRWLHRMAYDAGRQKVVLVGGLKDGTPNGEVWEWDGVNWTRHPIDMPTWRYGFGMAYDPRRDVTVVFAGDDGYGWTYFNDVWERDNTGDWVWYPPEVNPQARQQMSTAYFPRLRRTIFYGGFNSDGVRLDETLGWNGNQWRLANLAVHPTGGGGAMVYDPMVNGLLLYIGISPVGQLISETWYLR